MKRSSLIALLLAAGCVHTFHSPMSYDHGLGASKALGPERVASVPAKGPPPTPASEARGAALYETNCVMCHGATAQGDGSWGEDLDGVRPANLIEAAPRRSDRELFALIAFGRGDMPTWGETLGERDVWALVHHLRERARRPPPPLTD